MKTYTLVSLRHAFTLMQMKRAHKLCVAPRLSKPLLGTQGRKVVLPRDYPSHKSTHPTDENGVDELTGAVFKSLSNEKHSPNGEQELSPMVFGAVVSDSSPIASHILFSRFTKQKVSSSTDTKQKSSRLHNGISDHENYWL